MTIKLAKSWQKQLNLSVLHGFVSDTKKNTFLFLFFITTTVTTVYNPHIRCHNCIIFSWDKTPSPISFFYSNINHTGLNSLNKQ